MTQQILIVTTTGSQPLAVRRNGQEVTHPVGPSLDLLAPSTVRELGIGPGVVWRISLVGP